MAIPLMVVLILATLIACGGGDDDDKVATPQPATKPTTEPLETPEPTETVTITIGNLTDKTGPAAQAMHYIDIALMDAINYYNDNNLIPGVELKLEEYDTQYDPGKVRTGYEWLKERDVDVLSSFLPTTPEILSSVVNEDQMVTFTSNADRELLYPPGFLFAWANLWEETIYTQLKWVAENHWDYQTDGPARLGGAGWNDGATNLMFDAAEEYATAHPDQFEWVGGHLTNFSFTWEPEVEALKDCDYVFIPTVMHTFAQQYATAGYDTTYLAAEPQTMFIQMITASSLWDELDGTLFAMNLKWWDQGLDEAYILVNSILDEAHPDAAEVTDIKQAGRSYITVALHAQLCEIIKSAAETVGVGNIDSQAIRKAAENWSFTVDGLEFANFSDTKRNGYNYYMMSQMDAEAQTLITISDWLPVQTAP